MTTDLPADALILAGAALLAAGVIGAGFADRLRVPGLLLFLGIGMVIGDDALNLVSLDDPEMAQFGGAVALALILFEGGLTTRPSDVRRAIAPAGLLATVGVVVTAAVVAAGVLLVLDVDLVTAALLGSVVASTDAAAVFTVLRRAPLRRRLTSVLEVESGFNDPMAIVLTLGLIEAWRGQASLGAVVAFGLVQLVGGLVVGYAVGQGGAWLMRRADLGPAGLYPVLALALCGLSYGIAAAAGASGFLAVYVAGVIVGARVPRHRRDIRTFHDGLANTAEIGLFLLLGVLVFPSQLPGIALPAIAVAVVLVLLARPLAVLLCLPWFGFRLKELTLVSWAGLRGAVPIVLATFPFTAGHPEGEIIFDVVFFVVLISAAVQGLTIAPLATRLGLEGTDTMWRSVAEALPLEGVDVELVEVNVDRTLPIAGKRVRDAPLPEGALLTVVVRGERVVVPRGNTRIKPGDLLLVAMAKSRHATASEVTAAWARGELRAEEPY